MPEKRSRTSVSPRRHAAALSLSTLRPQSEAKTHGVHYTPPELADFLARRILGQLDVKERAVRVLDPACGEGELLAAFADSAP